MGDKAEIEKTVKRWAEMPASARAEFENKFLEEQKQFVRHYGEIGKNHLNNALTGALISGFCGLFSGWFIVFDVILGSLAGYQLSRRGGGQYRGMTLFGIAYFIGFCFKGAVGLLGAITNYASAFIVPVWTGGALISLVIGSAYGLYLERKHMDNIS